MRGLHTDLKRQGRDTECDTNNNVFTFVAMHLQTFTQVGVWVLFKTAAPPFIFRTVPYQYGFTPQRVTRVSGVLQKLKVDQMCFLLFSSV